MIMISAVDNIFLIKSSTRLHYLSCFVVEHELVLVFFEELAGTLFVKEQAVNPLDILDGDLRPFPLLGHKVGDRYQLDGISQAGLPCHLGQNGQRVLRYLTVLLLAPDLQYLFQLLLLILCGGDDDGSVQQVERHSMRGGVTGAPDLCNSSVCRHHNHRSHVVLHGAVEEGEALHVQHVNLVNEKHPRSNFCLPLFSPFRHFGVNLVPHPRFDLSCITTEESEESLSPRINHIDLVQSDSVYHLLPLLKFSLWTLDKPRTSPRSVIIPGSCKTPSQSCDLAGRLVDGDHVPRLHLLLDHRLDHLVAQVVDSFHFCCLEGQLTHLSPSAGGWSINLDFNNFSLNDLGLFADSHTNAFPERLS